MELDKITELFGELETKIGFVDEINARFGKTLALDFNSLDFWRIDENKVSEILAFFLDPLERHHQGDLYLKLFIEHFDLDFTYSNVKEIKVETERVIDFNRRIDVFLSYNGNEKLIAIENKIRSGTKDQENQIADYINYLKRLNNDNFHLLYLAPKEKVLSDKSISAEERKLYIDDKKLILINYEDNMVDLIHKFAIHSENDRVRAFLLDFERKLRQMYLGMDNINDAKIISQFIAQREENINLAFKIAGSLKDLKESLELLLNQQMYELAEEFDIEYVAANSHFALKNLSNHYVKLNFEMGGIIYGIVKTPDRYQHEPNRYSIQKIENLFPNKFKSSQWWPLYDFMYEQIDANPEFWIDVKKGVIKKKMRDFISNVIDKTELEA
ncbi:PD-(D/E)XK nuclease family protein [Pedobacter sp. MR2016-19]|uniref:PDDEXK-like family protein n=1 Tax=Pedobacter sp. MR2016-19 TaxID=2780089 RepID=UPI0018741A80|nr:PD-(D/E)XK nuclease family protein [Pedobacter sp. MR2016-19]MBE5320951.1 PD-(D/E)XK nuclease family protein [Pedobacter sp. MR2016-19]